MSSTSAVAGAAQARVAFVVDWVAEALDVGALVAVELEVEVASGAVAVALAHPAMSTERIVAAMSRIANIIAEFRRVRGKTSLKTYDRHVDRKRNSGLGYWGWLALIILVIVIGIFLLYAYRAYSPAV